jgi:hypothetical protein
MMKTKDERYAKTPSCEERIDAELAKELDRIRQATVWQRVTEVWSPDDLNDESPVDCIIQWAEENGLEAPTSDYDCETIDDYLENILETTPLYTVYRVGLSWGGPADGFYVYVDPEDKTISKIEYYFQDWHDGATRTLSNTEQESVEEVLRIALGLDM